MHLHACVCMINYTANSLQNITWSELGKPKKQAKMSIVQSNIEMGVGGSQEREKPRERKYCQTRPAPGSQVSTSAR